MSFSPFALWSDMAMSMIQLNETRTRALHSAALLPVRLSLQSTQAHVASDYEEDIFEDNFTQPEECTARCGYEVAPEEECELPIIQISEAPVFYARDILSSIDWDAIRAEAIAEKISMTKDEDVFGYDDAMQPDVHAELMDKHIETMRAAASMTPVTYALEDAAIEIAESEGMHMQKAYAVLREEITKPDPISTPFTREGVWTFTRPAANNSDELIERRTHKRLAYTPQGQAPDTPSAKKVLERFKSIDAA